MQSVSSRIWTRVAVSISYDEMCVCVCVCVSEYVIFFFLVAPERNE